MIHTHISFNSSCVAIAIAFANSGGYYTSRHIVNAWTRCVESGEDFRSSLEEAVEDINIELRRKQEEYGEFDD